MEKYKWKDFFEQSDRFIQEWSKSPQECALNSVYLKASGEEKSFLYSDKDYMPEPFLGNPERCSAVMLNLNPAAPMDKFHKGHGYAKQIISDGYSERAKGWKIFEEKDGGFVWWAKRENWLNRIIGNEDTTLKPFAIEICPWHSKKWKSLNYENQELLEEIRTKVLTPAFDAAKNSALPFVVAIGKDYCTTLEKMGFEKECELGPDRCIEGWPKNKNGNNVNRMFTLLNDGKNNRLLCIWSNRGGSNKPPQEGFDPIIKSFIERFRQ